MVFAFVENALYLGIFTHDPVPHSKLRQNVLKICFPQQQKGVEKTDLLYQNSIWKYEDDWEH